MDLDLLWQVCHLTFPSNSEMAHDVEVGIKWQRSGMSSMAERRRLLWQVCHLEMASERIYYGRYVAVICRKWQSKAPIMAEMAVGRVAVHRGRLLYFRQTHLISDPILGWSAPYYLFIRQSYQK